MQTRVTVPVVLALLAVLPGRMAAQELTPAELVDAIVRDGPRAQAIRSAVEVTHREQLSRTAFPNPSVGYSREGAGFTEFLQVQQFLPLFGVRDALSQAGVAATAAAEAERDAQLWNLRADAEVLVASLKAAQARLDVTRSTVAQTEALIGVLRIREQEGEGSRFDRLRAEQELLEARQDTVEAVIRAVEARATLRGWLPQSVRFSSVTGDLYRDEVVPAVEVLVARAVAGRRELQALARSAERADHEAEAARKARMPSPGLFGGLKRADGVDERLAGALFGVTVSVPLLDNGSRDVARWRAEATRVTADRSSITQAIETDVMRAAEVLNVRRQAFTAVGDDLSSGEELAGIAEIAYREGEIGILELLDAYRTTERARLRAIGVRLDARLAQIALQRAVGERLWP
jgi:cobalt-zinc-cadmium efflux system outer membrane protein